VLCTTLDRIICTFSHSSEHQCRISSL